MNIQAMLSRLNDPVNQVSDALVLGAALPLPKMQACRDIMVINKVLYSKRAQRPG